MEGGREGPTNDSRQRLRSMKLRVFRVQINGSTHVVSLEQSGKNHFRATLNGVSFEAEAASNGEITTWLIRNESESTIAHARNLPNDRVDVWIACIPFATTVQAIGLGGYGVAPKVRPHTAGGEVRALMPGRITSILVKEGESVSEGAALLILDAMKMQNEIAAPTDGKVKKIFVREGDTVKKDSVLVSIE